VAISLAGVALLLSRVPAASGERDQLSVQLPPAGSIIASVWGFLEAAVASVASTLAFNFFFLPPVAGSPSPTRRTGWRCSASSPRLLLRASFDQGEGCAPRKPWNDSRRGATLHFQPRDLAHWQLGGRSQTTVQKLADIFRIELRDPL